MFRLYKLEGYDEKPYKGYYAYYVNYKEVFTVEYKDDSGVSIANQPKIEDVDTEHLVLLDTADCYKSSDDELKESIHWLPPDNRGHNSSSEESEETIIPGFDEITE